MKEANKAEAMTRRRTEFDFDLWDTKEDSKLPSPEWIKPEAITHAAKGTGKFIPNSAKDRNFSTGTKIPAVEVPDAGASYNPNIEDHQTLLWKAAMVEIEKEKEIQKIERQTTGMFPSRNNAPTEKTYIQEMSEGIVELNGNIENIETEDKEANILQESDNEEQINGTKKPKTRKQKRDKRGRMFQEQKIAREKDAKLRETEIVRVKSIKKELKSEESDVVANQEKRKIAKEKKMNG